VVKYGQKTTQIKKQYFVLKSLLLKPMKLKRNPTTASEGNFEPQLKILVAEDESILVKVYILKFCIGILIARNGS
jgi:hypothetical protein